MCLCNQKCLYETFSWRIRHPFCMCEVNFPLISPPISIVCNFMNFNKTNCHFHLLFFSPPMKGFFSYASHIIWACLFMSCHCFIYQKGGEREKLDQKLCSLDSSLHSSIGGGCLDWQRKPMNHNVHLALKSKQWK